LSHSLAKLFLSRHKSALRQAQCERYLPHQSAPFVVSLSNHEWNRLLEAPINFWVFADSCDE